MLKSYFLPRPHFPASPSLWLCAKKEQHVSLLETLEDVCSCVMSRSEHTKTGQCWCSAKARAIPSMVTSNLEASLHMSMPQHCQRCEGNSLIQRDPFPLKVASLPGWVLTGPHQPRSVLLGFRVGRPRWLCSQWLPLHSLHAFPSTAWPKLPWFMQGRV